MQDTVVIRRIDELGRIVIPKDMRKTLKLDIGDPMTFWVEKEELILRRYSPVDNIGGIAKKIAEGLEEVTEKACIITDKEKVVYASGKNKEILSSEITEELKKVIKAKKSLLLSKTDGGEMVPVSQTVEILAENQIIVPIISDGECSGAVILYDKDKTQKFESNSVNLVRLSAVSIAKQI